MLATPDQGGLTERLHPFGAFCVFYIKRRPLVVSKVELAEIPLQMLLADVVIGAIDATLSG
jgi:hypothetical protein